MALPRPVPPFPSGRVTKEQLIREQQVEKQAYAALKAAKDAVVIQEQFYRLAVSVYTDAIDELINMGLPEQTDAIDGMIKSIRDMDDPDITLGYWRDAVQATAEKQWTFREIISSGEDVVTEGDKLSLAVANANGRANEAQAATRVVQSDLNNISLTP